MAPTLLSSPCCDCDRGPGRRVIAKSQFFDAQNFFNSCCMLSSVSFSSSLSRILRAQYERVAKVTAFRLCRPNRMNAKRCLLILANWVLYSVLKFTDIAAVSTVFLSEREPFWVRVNVRNTSFYVAIRAEHATQNAFSLQISSICWTVKREHFVKPGVAMVMSKCHSQAKTAHQQLKATKHTALFPICVFQIFEFGLTRTEN